MKGYYQITVQCGITYLIRPVERDSVQLRKLDKDGVMISASGLTPQEARKIGEALIDCARRVGGEAE